MSTEEILRQKLRRGAKVAFRTSRDTFRTRKDEKNYEKDGIFDRENGFKGKLEKRVKFRGTQLGEERSREKFRNFDSNGRKKRGYANERMNENGGICDRENGFKGKLEKRVNFRGTQLGEERSGEKFHERGKFRNFDSIGREKRVYANERMNENDGVCDRENGFKGKLEKRVNFRGTQLGEERSGEKFYERGKSRSFDSSGRKRGVYANERMNENESGEKSLFKKRENKEVKDEGVKGKGKAKTHERTMWVPGKSRNVSSNSKEKVSTHGVKEKKENDVLATAKWKTKGKERDKMGFIGTDDHGSGFVKKKSREDKFEFNTGKRQEEEARGSDSVKKKKNREDQFEFSKRKRQDDEAHGSGSVKKNREDKFELSNGKRQEVVPPSSSDKRNVRDEVGLDDDAERSQSHDRRKKKKWLIKLDPYDISNKRLDDAIGIDGSTEEKNKDSEKEAKISKNAEFRAIQPSPSILSFVEKNLLGRRRMIDIKRAGYNIDLPAPLDNIPFSTSTERENIEENIFRNRLEFFAAAKVSSSFPPPNLPEIAFAGRSNVGKSSLLNALTRQWGVVRTSDKPGLTQTINFFNLGTKLCLVDLPGYGFAYAKEEVKEAWEDLVKEYVSTRVGLKRVCLLIDTKWGMKPRDIELIDLMERSKTKYQIVLTKTDTVFPIDVARRAMQIEESLLPNKSVVQPLMMASSKSGAGIRSLRTVLANIARFVKI